MKEYMDQLIKEVHWMETYKSQLSRGNGWKIKAFIPDSNRRYTVFRCGLIHDNQRKKWLKPFWHCGYLTVKLRIKEKPKQVYLHRVVAEAFAPKHPSYTEVVHLNGDRSDNHSTNLSWINRSFRNRTEQTSMRGIKAFKRRSSTIMKPSPPREDPQPMTEEQQLEWIKSRGLDPVEFMARIAAIRQEMLDFINRSR